MVNFDYKEFSLKNLKDVLGEVIDQDDCNPEEIARSIIDACETNIDYHLSKVSKAAETIAKLKGLLKWETKLDLVRKKRIISFGMKLQGIKLY